MFAASKGPRHSAASASRAGSQTNHGQMAEGQFEEALASLHDGGTGQTSWCTKIW